MAVSVLDSADCQKGVFMKSKLLIDVSALVLMFGSICDNPTRLSDNNAGVHRPSP